MKKQLKQIIETYPGATVRGNEILYKGVLYPLPLVRGNKKIGRGVWHASTLAGCGVWSCYDGDGVLQVERGTCPLTCAGCYGCAGCYLFNNVKWSLMRRTRFLRNNPALYFHCVKAQIIAQRVKLLRVHATGDFLPGEAAGYIDVFKTFPHLIGWTYTKHEITGDIRKLNALINFNIVDSNIRGCGFNFGKAAYILKVYDKLQRAGRTPYVCRCGVDKNQHCDKCNGCALNTNVLFLYHGADYDPETDPDYITLKELINAQPLPGLPAINAPETGAPLLQPLPVLK